MPNLVAEILTKFIRNATRLKGMGLYLVAREFRQRWRTSRVYCAVHVVDKEDVMIGWGEWGSGSSMLRVSLRNRSISSEDEG